MILDYVNRMKQYDKLFPNFTTAMEFALSVKDLPVGRYEEGDYFALVQEFNTAPLRDKKFELHKKYLDVHIVLSGEEVLEYEDIAFLEEETPYNPDKDSQKLNGTGQAVVIKEGMFCLVFAHDGHKPGCCFEKSANLRKIVLKIPMPKGSAHNLAN